MPLLGTEQYELPSAHIMTIMTICGPSFPTHVGQRPIWAANNYFIETLIPKKKRIP